MASERDAVLASIQAGAEVKGPDKIEEALRDAASTRELQLTHDHELKKLKTELGWFGLVFGSEAHAAVVIAFIVVVLGFGTAIGLWITAYFSGKPDFWSSEAHLALAAATSALGYVFGRGSKDGQPSK